MKQSSTALRVGPVGRDFLDRRVATLLAIVCWQLCKV